MARLDRLVTAKAVAQYAAVIGRQFAYELLQAVSQLDEATLQRELGRLVEAEIVYQRGVPPQATYMFKHALIQDAAYESLLKSTRQQYHQRIAQVLEAQFPETAEAQPELLAHHYTEAGLHAQAVRYWQQAGQRASERSAHVEAISHLTKGLELLQTLPETPERAQREVDLQIALGQAFIATKGQAAPEVDTPTAELGSSVSRSGRPRSSSRCCVDCGIFMWYGQSYRRRGSWGSNSSPWPSTSKTRCLFWGPTSPWGALCSAWASFPCRAQQWEQQPRPLRPLQHHAHVVLFGWDLGVFGRSWASHALWALGYPDQALAMSREALTLAQELSHPFSLAVALDYAADAPSVPPRAACCPRARRGGHRALYGAGVCLLPGVGDDHAGLGAGCAGSGRGRYGPDTPWAGRLAGHGGGTAAAVLSGAAGRGVRTNGSVPQKDLTLLAEALAHAHNTGRVLDRGGTASAQGRAAAQASPGLESESCSGHRTPDARR